MSKYSTVPASKLPIRVTYDELLSTIALRAATWAWEVDDQGDMLKVQFTTNAPMFFDMTNFEVAHWLRSAHKDGWTIEPFTCLVLETLADLFDLKTGLDIGTHFGFISMFLLRMPGMKRVDGIEMNPGAVAAVKSHLRLNMELSPDTRYCIHQVGLSDVSAFGQTVWFDGMRLSFTKHNRFTEAKMDILSLCDFCDRIGYVPDLLKIDIEGFEGSLVDDLNVLLDSARPKVLLELHWDEIVERHGSTRKEIMMTFLSRGYTCGRLNWHQKMPKAGFMQEVVMDNLDEMLSNKNHAMYAFF